MGFFSGLLGAVKDVAGPLIGAAGSLLGGKNASDAAAANNAQNYENQKEFAQHGIRWKVADAKAAGLHPLAAIGGAGASFTPSSSVVGDSGLGAAANHLGDAANSFIDGQNTKRAQNATATQYERELADLQLERARLQNRYLEAQITTEWANVMGQPSNPPMPTGINPGAKSAALAVRGGAPALHRSGLIDGQPSVAISPSAGDPSTEAGKNPLWKAHQASPGLSIKLPSQSASEGLEALPPGALAGIMGASHLQEYWKGRDKPKTPLPDGYHWQWNPNIGRWITATDNPRDFKNFIRSNPRR